MKEHFSEQLEDLRRQLIFMGSEVEKQIRSAVTAVVEANIQLAHEVVERDAQIDALENQIEENTIKLIALQQPVAIDLRFLVSVLKINNDLERIGDHAENIAEAAERLGGTRNAKPKVDLPHMADLAMAMLKDSLTAFIDRNPELARDVIRRDDALDERTASIIRELLTYMAENPALISRCIEILSIARNLERVGDLATNIAEDTIFITEARLVKHQAL